MYISRCDDQGRFVHLNQAWLDFARHNWRVDFDPAAVLGVSWRAQITDPTTRQLYDRLAQRARQLARALTVSYRCDSPDRRRFMEMRVRPLSDGGLEWASRSLREEPRPAVDLLAARDRNADRLLRVCSWCKRIQAPEWAAEPSAAGDWLEVERIMPLLADLRAGFYPALTHGVCPDCYERVMAEIQAS